MEYFYLYLMVNTAVVLYYYFTKNIVLRDEYIRFKRHLIDLYNTMKDLSKDGLVMMTIFFSLLPMTVYKIFHVDMELRYWLGTRKKFRGEELDQEVVKKVEGYRDEAKTWFERKKYEDILKITKRK